MKLHRDPAYLGLLHQGDLARERQKYKQAAHHYEDALRDYRKRQQDPDIPMSIGLCNLGIVLYKLDKHEKAFLRLAEGTRYLATQLNKHGSADINECEALVIAMTYYATLLRSYGEPQHYDVTVKTATMIAMTTIGPNHSATEVLLNEHPLPANVMAELIAQHGQRILALDTAQETCAPDVRSLHPLGPEVHGTPRRPEIHEDSIAIPLSATEIDMVHAQLRAFREKFGRDPGPNDPIFFDPDADEPRPFPEEALLQGMQQYLRAIGVPPEFCYAFEHTQLYVTAENRHLFTSDELAAWDQAVRDFQGKQSAGDGQ